MVSRTPKAPRKVPTPNPVAPAITSSDQARPGPMISETVSVGGTPGSPTTGTPPVPGQRYRIQAALNREYASGQNTIYMYNWLRSLTWPVDDITRDLGIDLYNRMQRDDGVAAAVLVLKSAILSEAIEVLTANLDEDDGGRAKVAEDIAALCRRTLHRLKKYSGFDGALWNMIDALPLGNKVGELIFGQGHGKDKGKLVVVALKPKRRDVLSFVVDVYMNLVGFLALVPGQAYPVQRGIILTDPDNIPNLLPREKFAVLSWRPEDGDPRGTSVLRPAYTAWNFKMQLWGEWMKFLANFIVPSYIGYLPEGAVPEYQSDPNGILSSDSDLLPIGNLPATNMLNDIMQLRNAGAGVFPFGAKVDVVQAVASASQAFDMAFTFLNDCIARAILGQTLATGEGKHDSRAAAQIHQDVLLLLVKQAKQEVCSMIERDIFTPMVRYNWGEDYLDLVPTASLGDVAEPDKAQLWAAAAALGRENMIVPSQWEELYAELGLPAAAAEDLRKLTERWNTELLVPGIAVQETGQVPGGAPTPANGTPNGNARPNTPASSTRPANGRTPAAAGIGRN